MKNSQGASGMRTTFSRFRRYSHICKRHVIFDRTLEYTTFGGQALDVLRKLAVVQGVILLILRILSADCELLQHIRRISKWNAVDILGTSGISDVWVADADCSSHTANTHGVSAAKTGIIQSWLCKILSNLGVYSE